MKRTMKVATKLALAIIMSVSLCACQKGSQSESSAEAYAGSESASVQFDLDTNLKSSAERETLSYGETADHIAVNCLVDNPSLGDERDFVRIVALDGKDDTIDLTTAVSGEFTFEPGRQYGIVVYTHNAADPELGDAALARGISSTISFPENLVAGSDESQLSCIVSYQNGADTEFISCTMPLQATSDLSFRVSEVGTVMSFGSQTQSECPLWVTVSDDIVVMSCVPGGDLWPGIENSGYMIYYVETIAK